jgi:hypothetical protein
MPHLSGESKPTDAQAEPANSEDSTHGDDPAISRAEENVSEEAGPVAGATAQPFDWWSASPPADWTQSGTTTPATDADPPKESAAVDVYFCGHTTFFSLGQALQAIAKEKLTGSLRTFWDQEPIDLLAQNGEIVFATTHDPELYCHETPSALANVKAEMVAKARDEQVETGTPFFLSLAREESIGRQAAVELVQYYGQRLFSQLWTASRVWFMFEKNAELPIDANGVPTEPDVDDWALESLRFVQDLGENMEVDPASIPAYTKEGFDRVQKLQLTSDEAQFASQFNGVRSVQQIAKNLRLDLKLAELTLFRFLALDIVECWPASTATKPERKSVLERFTRSIRRGR